MDTMTFGLLKLKGPEGEVVAPKMFIDKLWICKNLIDL